MSDPLDTITAEQWFGLARLYQEICAETPWWRFNKRRYCRVAIRFCLDQATGVMS